MNTDQLPLFAAQAPPPASPSRPARNLRAASRAVAAAQAATGAPPLDESTTPPDTVSTSARAVTAAAAAVQPPFLSVALELPLVLALPAAVEGHMHPAAPRPAGGRQIDEALLRHADVRRRAVDDPTCSGIGRPASTPPWTTIAAGSPTSSAPPTWPASPLWAFLL